MKIVSDLHLHSKYARAVSPQMLLHNTARVAKQKGIHLLSASDYTHPLWFKEIKEQLLESNEGVCVLKEEMPNDQRPLAKDQDSVFFLLSTEIACIYKQKEKIKTYTCVSFCSFAYKN